MEEGVSSAEVYVHYRLMYPALVVLMLTRWIQISLSSFLSILDGPRDGALQSLSLLHASWVVLVDPIIECLLILRDSARLCQTSPSVQIWDQYVLSAFMAICPSSVVVTIAEDWLSRRSGHSHHLCWRRL